MPCSFQEEVGALKIAKNECTVIPHPIKTTIVFGAYFTPSHALFQADPFHGKQTDIYVCALEQVEH